MAPTEPEAGALAREFAHARFNLLYRQHGRAILAYALRRVGDPEAAADVVAETFLIAWRRLEEVPIDDGRLWLYAVARRVIANLRRGERRRTQLARRLGESLLVQPVIRLEPGGEAAEVLQAMAELSDEDRELLLLVSWDELSPSQAAKVLGISSLAARSRLHRARRRLRALLVERDSVESRTPELELEEAR